MSPSPEPSTAARDVTGELPDLEVAPPTNRMVVAVLSLVGFFVALYLFVHYVGWVGSLVCGIGDCAAVQASPYSRV
ncbi:MAG TPA: hypothetical protein VE173_03690, partial [Longimicrobiales bacterium]|nr:hypothetical protein [Longimicrobiales bacterium]